MEINCIRSGNKAPSKPTLDGLVLYLGGKEITQPVTHVSVQLFTKKGLNNCSLSLHLFYTEKCSLNFNEKAHKSHLWHANRKGLKWLQ